MTRPRSYRQSDHLNEIPTRPAVASQDGNQRVAADLRRAAIARMMWMNSLHARNAWELRRRDPIAPHGLAFLFAQPDDQKGRVGWFRLSASTKLWLAGDEARDLPDRLFRYYQKLPGLLSTPGCDIRTLANRRDPEMSEEAVYIGLGVSSLDTSTGTWSDIVASATVTALRASSLRSDELPVSAPIVGDQEIPGCVRIVLTDGTAIVAERRGASEFNHQLITSTHTLNYSTFETPYRWGSWTHDEMETDPAQAPAFRWMAALNDLLWQTDEARLVANLDRVDPRTSR